jgi:hypothetical protein
MYQASETTSSTKAPAWGICWDAGAGADAGPHVVQQEQASRPGALCYQESGRISGWWRHPIAKWRRPQPEGSPGPGQRQDRCEIGRPSANLNRCKKDAVPREAVTCLACGRLHYRISILFSVEGFQKPTNGNPTGRSGRALGLIETVPKRDRQRLPIAADFPFPRRGSSLGHYNMVPGTGGFSRSFGLLEEPLPFIGELEPADPLDPVRACLRLPAAFVGPFTVFYGKVLWHHVSLRLAARQTRRIAAGYQE